MGTDRQYPVSAAAWQYKPCVWGIDGSYIWTRTLKRLGRWRKAARTTWENVAPVHGLCRSTRALTIVA